MHSYAFPCGCSFPIIGEAKYNFQIPRLKIDLYKISYTCEAAWDIIRTGNTVGVFQVETNLGQSWSKKISPDKIEHLSAIGAVLRPGCLRAITNGKSMTARYADRKNNREEVTSYHPVVDECLKETYNLLVYQEQAMALAVKVAGFSLEEADNLRKAIGKKLASEMAKVKTMFYEKAKIVNILTDSQIEEVFGWIQESQKYSFNASHSLCYSLISYWTAFAKAHGPEAFYTAWLQKSIGQQDGEEDIVKLSNNAMNQNIPIKPPTILKEKDNFYTNGQEIVFGLVNIKGVGSSVVKKLHEALRKAEGELGISFSQMNWLQFLMYVSPSVNSKAMIAMIMAGALDCFKLSRTQMKYEYEKFSIINDNELQQLKSKTKGFNQTLIEVLRLYSTTRKQGGVVANERRLTTFLEIVKTIENPPFSLYDNMNKVLENEKRLLGVALTYNVGDSINNDAVNCSCLQFIEGKPLQEFILGVEILDVRPYNMKGKNLGRQMYFVEVSDGSQNLTCTIFPDQFDQYGSLVTKGNRVLFFGKRDAKYSSSLTVQKVVQA